MYNPGVKINKAQIRQLPASVSAKVLDLQKYWKTRFCKLYIENPGWELYLGEGVEYSFFYNDKELSLNMVSMRTMGMAGPKEAYQVGRRLPVPQGTWIVAFEIFCGKPFINVHHIELYQLEEK